MFAFPPPGRYATSHADREEVDLDRDGRTFCVEGVPDQIVLGVERAPAMGSRHRRAGRTKGGSLEGAA